MKKRCWRWIRSGAALLLAVLICMVLLPARALAAAPDFLIAVPRIANDSINFDATRYLNQNTWYQNKDTTVWWAGFSGFERRVGESGGYPVEDNYLVPDEDVHVGEVTLTHLRDGNRDGIVYRVPKGNGTNAVSGDPVQLYDVYPLAKPNTSAEALLNDNAYPVAYDYVECGPEDATHLTARWSTGDHVWVDLGLTARGTHNWDAAMGTENTFWTRASDRIIEGAIPEGPGITKTVTYYRAVMPDAPHDGHDFAVLEITPEFGYYVTDVVITCCFRGDAYRNCSVYNTGHAFQKNFGVNKGDTVSLILDSESFCHGSNGGSQAGITSKYYIMIRTEQISNELFVEYDPGEIVNADNLTHDVSFGRDDEWLAMDDRGNQATEHLTRVSDRIGGPGHLWTPGDLDYKIDSVQPDVLESLSEDGWQFVGWDLEYYAEAENDAGTVTFEGDKWNGFEVAPGDDVRLKMHAKLIAEWRESDAGYTAPVVGGSKVVDHTGDGPGIQVTKLVEDWTDGSSKWLGSSDRTFTVHVQGVGPGAAPVEIPFESDGTVTGAYDAGTGTSTFSMNDGSWFVLRPDGTDAGEIYVWEDAQGDGLGPYYDIAYTGDGTACDHAGNRAVRVDWTGGKRFVTVHNEVVPRAEFQFVKVDPYGNGLVGAGFELLSADGKQVFNRSSGADGKVSFDNIWLPEGIYTLKETAAPDGYNLETGTYAVKVDTAWTETGAGKFFFNSSVGMYAPGDTGYSNPIVEFKFPNVPGAVLPSTGGPGTAIFYTIGSLTALAALAFLAVHKRKTLGKIGVLLLCASLPLSFATPARALPAESYAVLNVRYAPDGTPINSTDAAVVEYRAYKVADAMRNSEGGYTYTLTAAFQDSGIDVNGAMGGTQLSDNSAGTYQTLLNQFGTFINNSDGDIIPDATAVTRAVTISGTPENGIAQLTGLSDGLYLVTTRAVTTIGSTQYTAVPFLVNIPYEADGVMNNYLTITVKFTTYTPGGGPDPDPGPGPDNPDPGPDEPNPPDNPDNPDGPDTSIPDEPAPLSLDRTASRRAAARNAAPRADGDAGPVFRFNIELFTADGSGNEIPVDGTYPVITEGGGVIGTVEDGKGSFGLAENQSWRILGLPAGTTYRVTEEPADGWSVRSQYGTEGSAGASAKSLAVVVNAPVTVEFELPKTGGMGTAPYIIFGSMMALLSGLLLFRRRQYR